MKLLRLIASLVIISCSFTAQANKVFELRTYYTHDGKLPDLLSRFENHTVKLFEKHQMTNIGYWLPTTQSNTLIYIISHESQAAAEKNWQAFVADPIWVKAYQASRVNGPLVKKLTSEFLMATSFSALK
ncbi:MAG: NIPSNAP family protein [Thalassotalea sp.]